MKSINLMVEPFLSVVIMSPDKIHKDKYYTATGDMDLGEKSDSAPAQYQKAIILNSFDLEKYPIDSEWMISETKGIKANFFGEPKILIKWGDLRERLK